MPVLQLSSDGVLQFASNYGFAALMALLFWHYIRNQGKQIAQSLNSLNETLGQVEKQLDRLKRMHDRDNEP